MRLEKNYPVYTFVLDNGKSVIVNIADNTSAIIGISGKPLKSDPKHLNFPFGRAVLDKRNGSLDDKSFNLYDKIISLPNVDISMVDLNRSVLNRLLDYKWKDIKNFFDNVVNEDYDYSRIVEDLDTYIKTKNLSEEQKIIIMDAMNKCKSIGDYLDNEKFVNLVCKYYDSDYSYCFSNYKVLRLIIEYHNICTKLGKQTETGDLAKNYKKAKEEYIARQTETEDNFFRANQSTHSLGFEDDNFVVIVPTTRLECINEGSALHNCLGGYEWNNFLSKGIKKVVFIRKKNAPETPYIACDMDNNLNIIQFLTYNNCDCRNGLDREFKKKYQAYLNTLV